MLNSESINMSDPQREVDSLRIFQDAIKQKSTFLKSTLTSTCRNSFGNMRNEVSSLKEAVILDNSDDAPYVTALDVGKMVSLVKKYLSKLKGNSKRYLDNVYGVYQKGNILMIGNSPIEFEGNIVKVCDATFQLTEGLLQLLFRKNPDGNRINSNDLENYRMIIVNSSAHKKLYCANESIRKLKSKKFYNFISPMFEQSSREFLGLKDTISGVKNANVIGEKKYKTVKRKGSAKVAKLILNPLKLINVDPNQEISQINSHSLEETSNGIDNYYESDYSSEGTSDFSTSEYSPRRSRIRVGMNYNFINWRYQPESKKRQWTSDDEEVVPKIWGADVTTAYELDIWDDPNKLVDRLRVLIAEQNMATNSAEIYFILEELRNARLIY